MGEDLIRVQGNILERGDLSMIYGVEKCSGSCVKGLNIGIGLGGNNDLYDFEEASR